MNLPWLRSRKARARKEALRQALMKSILLTEIEVPPPRVTAAELRARAKERADKENT